MLMTGRRWGVVELDDLSDLGDLLGFTPWKLEGFADCRSFERTARKDKMRNYRYRWIPKRSGGARLIEAPKPILAHAQRTILRNVFDHVPAHDAVHGFVQGRSVVSAAAPHVGSDVVIRLDLDAYFASVPVGRVFVTLCEIGYARDVAHRITGLLTNTVPAAVLAAAPVAIDRRVDRLLRHVHLPQGAPTSPAVANLASYGVDRRLTSLASRFDGTYTRYADDMTISGGSDLRRHVGRFLAVCRTIVNDEGFRLNDRKTRVVTQSGSQQVLGVVVNQRVNPKRRDLDRLRAELHEARVAGPDTANRGGVADYRNHLLGRIAWVGQLNAGRAARLRRQFDGIDWSGGSGSATTPPTGRPSRSFRRLTPRCQSPAPNWISFEMAVSSRWCASSPLS